MTWLESVETRFLHDAQEVILVDLAVAAPVRLLDHLLQLLVRQALAQLQNDIRNKRLKWRSAQSNVLIERLARMNAFDKIGNTILVGHPLEIGEGDSAGIVVVKQLERL